MFALISRIFFVSEGLPELHSRTPSCRWSAAVRLWHTRLSAAVWLLGRFIPTVLYLVTSHLLIYLCWDLSFQKAFWPCKSLILQNLADFSLSGQSEDGRGKCSFDPSQSFTTVMVGELSAILPPTPTQLFSPAASWSLNCVLLWLFLCQMESCTQAQLITSWAANQLFLDTLHRSPCWGRSTPPLGSTVGSVFVWFSLQDLALLHSF